MKTLRLNWVDLIFLMWINPLIGLPVCVLTNRIGSLDSGVSLLGILSILVGAFSYFVSGKFSTLLACLFVFWWLSLDRSRLNKLPNLWFAYWLIFVGVIISVVSTFKTGERIGVLGNEINFSGYIVFLFWLIALERRWNFWFCVLLVFGCLVATKSRALLLNFGISVPLYLARRKPIILVAIIVVVFSLAIYNETIFSRLSHFDMFKSGGYTTELDRLMKFNDSSYVDRNDLNHVWLEILKDRVDVILFGMDSAEYEMLSTSIIGNVPHSDYIDKTVRGGVLYLVVCIVFMFVTVPMWIGVSILCYAFLLHATISIPWVICIAFSLERVNANSSESSFFMTKQRGFKILGQR